MKGWKKVKFGELIENKTSFSLKKGEKYSHIPMENVIEGYRKPSFIDSKEFNGSGSRFKNQDTLFARITPCLQNRKIAYASNLKDGIGFGSTEFFIFRAKEAVTDSKFLYYLSNLTDLRRTAELSMTGASGRQRANLQVVKDYEIQVPIDKKDHIVIANIISSYDDLIENNQKRINILEEMAQRLYTEWFVKFNFPGHENEKMVDSGSEFGEIPEGWEVRELQDLVEIKKGKNITRKTVKEGYVPVVAGGLEPAYFHNMANTKAPVITVSASGANAGYVNIYYQEIWASDCSYIDQNSTKSIYYFYLVLKNKQNEINNLQKGSAQPHVYPKDLQKLKTVSASSEILEAFHKIVSNYYEEVKLLKKQNETCSGLRDLLIENLITGKRLLKQNGKTN